MEYLGFAAGSTETSITVTSTIWPFGAPTGVTAVGGSGQVTVSWGAPLYNGGSAIVGYSVTASPGGQSCITTGALSKPGAAGTRRYAARVVSP